jgi:hypothetical protein
MGIISMEITEGYATWYSINGGRMDCNPTARGLYIFNGKKVIIK